jgi:hypothetical protein
MATGSGEGDGAKRADGAPVSGLPPEADPKGLVRESYRIDGIGPGECRSIFMDWALSLPGGGDPRAMVRLLLAHFGARAPDHPMTEVLREALAETEAPRRRGGWAGRRGGSRASFPAADEGDPPVGSG